MIHRLKKCALCGSEDELELSHIVPKMVIRKLKKTAVGNIRSAENPNATVQDSEKHYMLCGSCEDLFSEYETEFAKTVFHPYLDGVTDTFKYDEKLFYFITSVSWRSLYWDLLDFVENNVVGIDALETLISAEKEMREYLLNIKNEISNIENHIFFFDDVKEIMGKINDVDLNDLRPNETIHRAISSYTVCYEKEKTYVTITNMLGIVLLTFYNLGKDERWINTKIVNSSSVIYAKNQQVASAVGNEFINMLNMAEESRKALSEKQSRKIVERLENFKGDISKAAVYKDWINDANLSTENRDGED